MKRPLPKPWTHFDLLETFRSAKGCALCELEFRDVRHYLDYLLYENVNDGGVRSGLVRSRGYCHRHAHLLLTFQDGLGTAILYEDQVKLLLEFLETVPGLSGKPPSKKTETAWNRHESCPACRMQDQSRDRLIAALLNGLPEPQMRNALEAGPGLCVPHLLLVLDGTTDKETKHHLTELHRKKYSDLLADLKEHIRKHDYLAGKEGFGKEHDAWIRAVNMMVGMKEVF